MSRRQLYKTSADVLNAIFALPSDDESCDDLEADSGDETQTSNCEEDVVSSQSVIHESDTSSDDDDDVLYSLADAEHSSTSDTEDSDSAAEETNWSKTVIKGAGIDFDAVGVLPVQPFVQSDGPLDFFSRFFDTTVYDMLVSQTNLYASQKKIRFWQDVDVSEMTAFLGILIGMGLHDVPHTELCWSSDPLFRIQPLADIMVIKRFKKIRQALHVNDNSQAPPPGHANRDKLFKLRPLIDKLNREFSQQCVQSSSQSIDEAMVVFKGRSSIKQYMPMKPVKRGYKLWIRADSKTGYVYNFEVYCGKDDSGQTSSGLGERVVRNLCQALRGTQCHITFDNFFSSVSLMEELYAAGMYATGTVRTTRIQLPLLARQKTQLAKGQHKWRSKDNTAYVVWQDSKPVHILSTAFDPTVVTNVKRTQKDGTTALVSCPEVVHQYTARMGGVDRFDERRGRYNVSKRSRKWWMRIFYFLVDSAIANSLVLYNSVHPGSPMTMLMFRRDLFRCLTNNYTSRHRKSSLQGTAFVSRKSRRNPVMHKSPGVPDSIRLSVVGAHMPQQIAQYRRCRACSTQQNNKRSKIICSACGVSLCVHPCFADFHK